jgi:phage protein D
MTAQSSLYVSSPIIEIEGVTAERLDAFKRDIQQISVEESLSLPGMFTLIVNNPYAPTNQETRTWQYDDLIQMGKKIKLGFVASSTQSSGSANSGYILEGEITAIETHFTSTTQAPVVIRGYDISHRLHRGRYNRSFQNLTDSDIVKKLAEEAGIQNFNIQASGSPHDYVFQENQTNMEFLRERSARIGFELFFQDNVLHFRPPTAGESLQLTWLQDIESFRARVTSSEQVRAVEVRGWDYRSKGQQEIVAIAPKPSALSSLITQTDFGAGTTTSQLRNHPLPPKLIVVDRPIWTVAEAETMANALWNEVGGEFVVADAHAPGNPKIRVGKVVRLDNMGRYNGNYYVTDTRHTYYEGVYHTEFSVRGLRGGDLLNVLRSGDRLQPGQTFLVGIVTHNHDPEELGRVRVRFPTLNPEHNGDGHSSQWARVVCMGAGVKSGFDWLPEINDEVLVGFEHGDIHRPYILGSVWNAKHEPPVAIGETVPQNGTSQGKVRLRTLKTRTGHTLQFIEEDQGNSKAGIIIQTAKGHEIYLNDSNGEITLKTSSGQTLKLDQDSINLTASNTVNIQATGGVNISPGIAGLTVQGMVRCHKILTGIGATVTDLAQEVTRLNQSQTDAAQQMQVK